MNNSVVIVSVGAGYSYGSQGYTHHALEDIAVMRALPNMNIYIPADSIESKSITHYLCKTKTPSYLRLGKAGEPILTNNNSKPISNEIIDIRSGDDGTILFVGPIGKRALAAAEILDQMNFKVSVASVPFATDLDLGYLKNAAANGPIVTVEEHSKRGGFGSIILEALHQLGVSYKLKIVASTQQNLSEIGSQDYLQVKNGLDEKSIVDAFNSFR